MDLDVRDVEYIVEEVWRAKSALSRSSDHIALARWDRAQPTTIWNVVVLTFAEAERHELITTLAEAYPPDVLARIQRRLDEEKRLQAEIRSRGWA